MNLEAVITKEISEIESFGCRVFFFFDGLDSGPFDDPFGPSIEAMTINSQAFSVYEDGDAAAAINDFKQSGSKHVLAGMVRGMLSMTRLPGYAVAVLFFKSRAIQAGNWLCGCAFPSTCSGKRVVIMRSKAYRL